MCQATFAAAPPSPYFPGVLITFLGSNEVEILEAPVLTCRPIRIRKATAAWPTKRFDDKETYAGMVRRSWNGEWVGMSNARLICIGWRWT